MVNKRQDKPQEYEDRIPFANASEFMSWEAANCDRCLKYVDSGEGYWHAPDCPIEQAIAESVFKGVIPAEICERLGFTKNDVYLPDCPEIVTDPADMPVPDDPNQTWFPFCEEKDE